MVQEPADRPARARPAPRSGVLGLSARPGQRRAVRLIAVVLGLLALALGVRDALVDEPPAPADVQPVRSAGQVR